MTVMRCRFCDEKLEYTFANLGLSPLANSYVKEDRLDYMEPFYPLHVRVCEKCFLVQLPQLATREEIFEEYAYFSSYSDSWLEHCRVYADTMIDRFSLCKDNRVVELASNDGYLLKYFVQHHIPVLGVEPAANVAEVAQKQGVNTVVAFFGEKTAQQLVHDGWSADLIIGNNVLAHVPDINDFVRGIRVLLKPDGVVTIEFPHLMKLMSQNQFDTIYHEHFSYLSFTTVERVFASHGLRLFDVQELPTHGGSLRIFACQEGNASKVENEAVREMRQREEKAGISTLTPYLDFSDRVAQTKRRILQFLIEAKEHGKRIVGYGAPAKGNTLLNYCGIGTDFLDYTVDRNPVKQGRFLPGVHIPILAPEVIQKTKPDFVLILPWNIKDEIMHQMAHIREWGGQFVVPIPEVKVYP
ncbi:MAG: SAM-dependent methyltransferase [Candidatus Nitrospira kreftii]|uniref:SAM-dependent methyltransferase n=1 Tax=Candidatus Nitrospira kreftii TaxID=2652173 RepID=A0A7S8FD24_9BACT|nr:MAG: SAM-dependent methyltransferase [Candidatus Nitrospira kreftii]